jgi:hypothetical protein
MKTIPALDRSEFQNKNGLARWWSKDGAWHVARPIPNGHINPGNLLFTEESYATREEAVAALEVANA